MGLLDSLDDNTRLSLGLLAAAGPRADGAGFGQRLLEGINTGYAMGDAAEKRKMTQLQFQSAQRKSDLINAAIAGDQAPQQTQSPTGAPSAIGQPVNGMTGIQQQADMPMAPVSRGAAPWSQQKINAFAMTGDPGLQKAAELEQARQLSGQTDIGKLMAQAGIDSNSPLGKQITQQQLMKQNYVAPTSLRPGGYAQYADGRTEQMPHVPDGFTAIKGGDQAWHIVPVNGGMNAISASAQATTLGKTMGTLGQGVDTSGAPSYFLGLPPGVSGAKPQSGIQGNFSGDPSSIAAGIASIQDPQERVNAQAAFDQQVKASPPGSQVIRPANAPGFNQGQEALQTELSGKWTKLSSANSEAQNTTSYLSSIKDMANKAAVGPMSDKIQYVNGLLAGAGVSDRALDATTANNLLDKYSNQIVSRLGQGGLGTDAARAILQSAYPNAHMTKDAINEASDNLIGANKMVQAKTNLLQPHANSRDPQNYNNKETTFDQNADPALFANAAKYAQLKKSSPVDAKKFAQQVMAKDPSFGNRLGTLESLGVKF